MVRRRSRMRSQFVGLFVVFALSCGGNGTDDVGGPDSAGETTDISQDIPPDVPPDVPPPEDTVPDVPPPEDTAPDVPPADDIPPPEDMGSDGGASCGFHSECFDTDFCTKDRCTEGECLSQLASCDDDHPCTIDTCDPGLGCVHALQSGPQCETSAVLFEATFDDGTTSGLTVEDLALTAGENESAVVWTPDLKSHSGAGALYFGIPGTYNFDSGKTVASTARTDTIDLPSDAWARLSLWVYVDVEPEPDWDVLTVFVEADGGTTPVWTKTQVNTTMQSWQFIAVDLSAFMGKSVQVGVTFDSVEHTFNDSLGVVIDTLRVERMSAPKTCVEDADCDDGLSCSTESCESGACVYITGICCQSVSDCGDFDVCTVDLCGEGNQCLYVPVANADCCNNDADCEDNNTCTTHACADDLCVYQTSTEAGCCTSDATCDDNDTCTTDSCKNSNCLNINTCCQSDAACDDGDDVCTTDTCVNGKCKFALATSPNCCMPVLYANNFDDTGIEDWTLTSNSTTCVWDLVYDGENQSPPASLQFANPSTKKVDCATATGTARTPPIDLPDTTGIKLGLSALLPAGDIFGGVLGAVRVVPENGPLKTLLTGATLSAGNWNYSFVSLDAYKGQTIQIEFYSASPPPSPFSSAPSEGMYVDNLEITRPCGE